MWFDGITGMFLVKENGPCAKHLGNDYTYHDIEDGWTYNCLNYTKEAIARVERLYGCIPEESTPLPVTDCHPELDILPLLPLDSHRKF